MAKRGAIHDLGRHKVVRSQFSGLVIHDEQRDDQALSVYHTGQAAACLAAYRKAIDKQAALDILAELL
jgi:hypothetical protein